MNIFVAKLNFNTTGDELREAFEAFGEVDSAKVIMDHFSGKSRGFGFVEMPDDEQAWAAINELNDSELDGNRIVVKKAEDRRTRGGGGGGGGGRRRDNRGGGGYGNQRYGNDRNDRYGNDRNDRYGNDRNDRYGNDRNDRYGGGGGGGGYKPRY